MLLKLAIPVFVTISDFASAAVLAPAAVPAPAIASTKYLGQLSDNAFGVFRCDGGSGGFVNGYNLITLSDPRIGPTEGIPQVHTAYAYFGVADPTDPTNITIIGNYTDHNFNRVGGGGVIISDPSDACQGSAFAPGPFSGMNQLNSSGGGINIWTVYCSGKAVYNTMIEYSVRNPTTLNAHDTNFPAQRTVLRLFKAPQPMYGSAASLITPDGYFYTVAIDKTGIKLARVPLASREDITKYQYYNGDTKQYQSGILTNGNKTGNLYNNQGNAYFGLDLYFNQHLNTYIITVDNGVYDGLTLLYSTTGKIEGPYADGLDLPTPLDPDCKSEYPKALQLTYLGHSHQGYDPSGKTLLYSWSSCNEFLNMGVVTFK